MKVFAFRNEKRVEEKSSSGGAFMAVIDAAFKLCKTGGGSESVTLYGAVFNNDLEVVHSKATTIAECGKFHGSKYVFSSMGQNYKEVENDLLSGKCVLFSGTPCQVASIKSFLK